MSDLEQRFAQYHADNPHVYAMFKRFAIQANNAGFQHYSADAIFHRMRWHLNIETRDPDGFKINNNYISRYARMLAEEDPKRFGVFFRMRELRSAA